MGDEGDEGLGAGRQGLMTIGLTPGVEDLEVRAVASERVVGIGTLEAIEGVSPLQTALHAIHLPT